MLKMSNQQHKLSLFSLLQPV